MSSNRKRRTTRRPAGYKGKVYRWVNGQKIEAHKDGHTVQIPGGTLAAALRRSPSPAPGVPCEIRDKPFLPEGSTQIANAILTDGTLSVTAKVLYAVIKAHAEQRGDGVTVEIQQWELAQQLNQSIKHVQDTQANLVERRLIEVCRDKGYKTPNRYTILSPESGDNA